MNSQPMSTKNNDIKDFPIKAPEPQHLLELENFFMRSMQENFSYFPDDAINYYSRSWQSSNLLTKLENTNGFLLCAWNNDKIVGLVSGSLPEGGVATIIWLMVDSKFHNRQIGSQLLNQAKLYYKRLNAHKIKLTVHDTKAKKFYNREGFIDEALHKQHWWKMDFWSMAFYLK